MFVYLVYNYLAYYAVLYLTSDVNSTPFFSVTFSLRLEALMLTKLF